jgi:hypothetical protein
MTVSSKWGGAQTEVSVLQGAPIWHRLAQTAQTLLCVLSFFATGYQAPENGRP